MTGTADDIDGGGALDLTVGAKVRELLGCELGTFTGWNIQGQEGRQAAAGIATELLRQGFAVEPAPRARHHAGSKLAAREKEAREQPLL